MQVEGVSRGIFDLRQTRKLEPFLEAWGAVPLIYLERLSRSHFTYGFIGIDDLTMDPILRPGSFVQVDESRNRVQASGWHSEYQRPIYFVETREGYVCCWCTQRPNEIVLESHPLSPKRARIVSNSEAEVVGQVVGVAMRLGRSRSSFERLRLSA